MEKETNMIYTINAIIFVLLMLIWSKSDWKNFFIKIIFAGVGFANAFYALQMFGYLVKV